MRSFAAFAIASTSSRVMSACTTSIAMRDLLRAVSALAIGRARVTLNARSLAMTPRAELVRKYYGAYQARNRKTLEDGLADDFTFTSPYDDKIDKATYFERCWPNSQRMTLSFGADRSPRG
jgi:hypothetical protein